MKPVCQWCLLFFLPLSLFAGDGPSASCLTLQDGQFQASATFLNKDSGTFQEAGSRFLDQETGFDETGYFFFEDPDNIDLVVRVFDGCDFNDHFWVFAASLTNVEYELTVTDTISGESKTYGNSLGKIAPPIQDTQAFATCPSPKHKRSRVGVLPKMGEILNLHNDKFKGEIDWSIPGNGTGRGTVGVQTETSGAFWFLDQSDFNVYLQIIDGRTINGHYWLAYTSLTGADYTMTLTNNETGLQRRYHNPLNASTFGIDTLFDSQPLDLLYPWVSNSNTFDSTVVINNNNCIDAQVTLEATRGNGDKETTTRTIPANGFLEEAANDLFPELGTGPGYSVLLTSESAGLSGRWVTQSLDRNSPSQGVALQLPDTLPATVGPNARVGRGLSFGYLPVSGDFISAPVVVNVGDEPTDVSLYFYDRQGALIHQDTELGRGLPPNQPFASVANDLVPGSNGNISMVAFSPDAPLTGVVFIFNEDGEPAIGNATGIDFVPPQ